LSLGVIGPNNPVLIGLENRNSAIRESRQNGHRQREPRRNLRKLPVTKKEKPGILLLREADDAAT